MQPQDNSAPPAPDTVIAPTALPETEIPTETPPPAPQPTEEPAAKAAPSPAPVPALPTKPTPDTKTRVPNSLPVTEPGEHTVCVVKRHPIGIIGTYAASALVLIVVIAFAFIAVPHFVNDKGRATTMGALLSVVVAAVCAGFVLAANKVYWGNSWTVTTDSLTQIRRAGLFNRQSSQLSLKDLEDVTAGQDGVFARIFNYGVLSVETAGERSKFVFSFCPNPNYYAQQILAAREAFERNRTAEESQDSKTP